MQAGATGGGREEACILPAGGPGRRRGGQPGEPARAPAGGLLARRPGAACVPIAHGGGDLTGSAGIAPRQW
ncbi:hypothetical protein WS75_23755 [Burkholderia sp. FL-7-2-10-S1-D7]|nr:hypothetical protein WS75_23755 [Burkholderia sp. FL-7-2-10-S1-D7]